MALATMYTKKKIRKKNPDLFFYIHKVFTYHQL